MTTVCGACGICFWAAAMKTSRNVIRIRFGDIAQSYPIVLTCNVLFLCLDTNTDLSNYTRKAASRLPSSLPPFLPFLPILPSFLLPSLSSRKSVLFQVSWGLELIHYYVIWRHRAVSSYYPCLGQNQTSANVNHRIEGDHSLFATLLCKIMILPCNT